MATIQDKTRDAIADLPDLDDIRKEMHALRRQMEKMTSRAVAEGSDHVARLRNQASGRATDLYADGEALLSELGRELRHYEKRARSTVRAHPGQTLAVALGVGALIALLWRR
ncbi:MAG: hypothetical protein DI556_02200 [Rhodovulum sulfidophilum]|uniref:DUF883 domain-containing protein n=1 Tax=Rhodovulum sulfidophilum TaxID=35806 RepID=A0A2W5NHG7_RHOSU|nr:MAG: hypothetical protein DI556_02200 [Rhodovulum sulfidophilum]